MTKTHFIALTAATCLLLALAAQGKLNEKRAGKKTNLLVKDVPEIFTNHDDKYYSIRDMYSLEKQLNRDGFDDDGFSHNEIHYMSDPSAKSAIFKQVDDMTYVVIPERSSSKGQGTDQKERRKRNAVRPGRGTTLWPNGIVPYEFAPNSFNNQEKVVILQAMHHWEEKTCIRFRPQNGDQYRIKITSGFPRNCRSFIGRLHYSLQPQGLTLGPGCVDVAVVIHELGHAIGFFHEHNRVDRDEYISVITGNIGSNSQSQFIKNTKSNGDTLGLGYDYASIMHYSSTAFSRQRGLETIRAKQPNIPIGRAEELSPLDILKTNKLYTCGPLSSWPPLSSVVPSVAQVTKPAGVSCGSGHSLKGLQSITVRSPGYPYSVANQKCGWSFCCPKGFQPQVEFPGFQLDVSSGCSRDYAQLYFGISVEGSSNIVRYRGLVNGKICSRNYKYSRFSVSSECMSVLYKTDGSNSASDTRGLQARVTCVDVDECRSNTGCNSCKNSVGSFDCTCKDGYYHSPLANTCYDINECAYMNGGCEDKCVNMGGSYRCECRTSGSYLQTDALSCGTTRPSVAPGTPVPPMVITPSVGGATPPPTTKPTTKPITRPTSPPTTPPPFCGGTLTASLGVIQTPNWPLTYPLNFDCEWTIQLPDSNSNIRLTFYRRFFGIAGNYVDNCPKDYLRVYDGLESGASSFGTICDVKAPTPITTTSNEARLIFRAGPYHGPKQLGFRVVYQSINKPTTARPTTIPTTLPPTTIPTTLPPTTIPTTLPPTTRPTTLPPTTIPTTLPPTTRPTSPPLCGGTLTASSGVIQTPNWPLTYPLNFDCEWTIQLPDSNSNIRLTFHSTFGIAGNYVDNCPKDYLRVYDGLESGASSFGTICDLKAPTPITTTSNNARLIFRAGPYHGPKRLGFSVVYQSISKPTTTRPTIPPTTSHPITTQPTPSCPRLPPDIKGTFSCNRVYTANFNPTFGPPSITNGAVGTAGRCRWIFVGAPATAYQIRFTYFDIPDDKCVDNNVSVYDGYSNRYPLLERVCGAKCDDHIVRGTGRFMLVEFNVNSPGSFRGFTARLNNYST